MLLYALCTATTQVYYSYDVFFVARFVFLSEWNEVMCVCTHPASLFPALPWLSFVSSGKTKSTTVVCLRVASSKKDG